MVIESSIPAVLGNLARTQPDRSAYTFIDYEADPTGGLVETLTWAQVYQRSRAVADELSRCGSPGDRAAIVAPQSLDYIVGFFGAMQAGFIAVPLSVPQSDTHDERISAALRDCSPAAVLTTSVAVTDVVPYAVAQWGGTAPAVVELDALQIDPLDIPDADAIDHPEEAYLQYTSGSTRQPAGVVVTHQNVIANLEQVFSDYFESTGKIPPQATNFVSWLPFYHDMGLVEGVFAPLLASPQTVDDFPGRPGVLMSPVAFLQKPARWMQMLAVYGPSWSAAPNFAFDLAARRTTDDDLAGLDLGGVLGIINGSERIHSATLRRFNERFAPFNLPATTVRPSYGLAEATLYVASAPLGHAPVTARFDTEKLAAGYAMRCGAEGGTELVSLGSPRASTIRIVDPETRTENPQEKIGEIWVHGDNVAQGYWRNPRLSERTFGAVVADPAPGTPAGPWLRTGDLGVMSQGELFIIGRIKDLLIVNGRNHYPDDIEATVQEITGGRVAAIAVPDGHTERLVAVVEYKQRGVAEHEMVDRLRTVKREVTSAISKSHSLRVADLVLVAPGALPTTTSGKVRRSACVERYRRGEFSRLDVGV
ncbi:long-chain-fatty-acid--AMP ligase FadD26 [Mycolicibacterium litorale]|uniref:Long-chain-fatty-acid--AMP ligase FadD26 n=1 Tax=Mycolicibacterium litorale TaxID=758802 RepID=A0AAD1IJ65_9MYCO|nr:long chain fatty acid CoA FadD26 [Mycolicibacterium litorale]BBY15891.1 long-chain-fatty-acid--AMP ligase FadD26 [Mycolicibacterium litorale]